MSVKDAKWTIRLNKEKVRADVNRELFSATQDIFELDIKPMAQQLTRVKFGHNRRSIDTEVKEDPRGVVATLFSQSGYGGFLELGTRFMRAFPYLFPAFNAFREKLGELIATRVRAIKAEDYNG